MKGEQLLHALGEVDEEYLRQVDELRRIPPKKKRYTWIPMAACLCLVAGVTAWALRGGMGMPTKEGGQANSNGMSGSAQGVYVPPLKVEHESADMTGFFIYQGRMYSQVDMVQEGQKLVGAQLGESSGTIDEWTSEDQYLEGTGSIGGAFYEVRGYDPQHLLCMVYDYGVELFWNNCDITVSTGGDVLEEVFRLSDGIAQAEFQSESDFQGDTGCTTRITRLEQLEAWVNALTQAPALSSAETDMGQCFGHLYLTKADGVMVHLKLMGEDYVQIENLPGVCWQVEWLSILP
ncbi:hypothetical protein B5F98_06920 [Pseudoflavonifractor sp. An44]|uniref:hypothetical protein n=1 Tax=Pseudoflavonifractor sp. An44 TaxID=1965635 RepID=UPI000B38B2B6|nr:hypothetical protein [Pseudoflavonifractor sp. An44]OUN97042.1 hypothetical protein B5F98_06920 [Pseudoflavonifractor sp. An44]